MEYKMIEKANKKLMMVYYLLYIIAVLSAVAGYYSSIIGKVYINDRSELGIILTSIFIIYIIGSIPLSLGGFHYMTKKWLLLQNASDKIDKYTKAAILRLVIIGTSIAFGVFLFYITRSQSMIFCAGIAAIALFFCKPTQQKLISELQLEETED